MDDLQPRLAAAVKQFWKTRQQQAKKQGSRTGKKDQGKRGAVTGGAQMDGMIALVGEILAESGLPDATIYRKKHIELPGFFRATKEWDILVIVDDMLLASIEFKSQVGSFGNNYNNRTEEAIGNATDLWTAYREGAFHKSPRPWLGYLMLLEEARRSTSPVAVEEPHFPVFKEFRGASYAKRYEILCQKLVRERLYDAACFLLSNEMTGIKGQYTEPSVELSFARFVASLTAHVTAYTKTQK
ncbi:MAG: PaeR7I family type II restriction endonuclease [Verrucomicrobia bacterium]|nr:PaeR7I family type II restriction endonuclease [Verrucomicrobiota bacterium]